MYLEMEGVLVIVFRGGRGCTGFSQLPEILEEPGKLQFYLEAWNLSKTY